MPLTVNAATYAGDTARSPDSYRYLGPAHTHAVKDYIDVKRTAPKPTSVSKGWGKSEVKLTRTLTNGTDSVGDAIVSISTSFPVDAVAAQKELMLTDLGVFLGTATSDLVLVSHKLVH